VLDLGSGAGPTRSSPRRWSANTGHVTGIDMTPEMLAKVRTAAAEMGAATVEFVEGEAEQLPFPDASFHVVISNGVIDLIPDKNAVFAEIFRVLTPAGGSRSPTSRSRTRSAPRAAATSTSGPAELPGRCWKQHTRSS
jgi:arsenite methyltransferase